MATPVTLVNDAGTTQQIAPIQLGASTDVAFNGTSAQSGALVGTLVRLVAKTADCRILEASSPTALSTSTLLMTGIEYYFKITSGNKIAVIRDASTDGTLNITVCG